MRLFNPKVRTGQDGTRLGRDEFLRRGKERFVDPAFDVERNSIDRLAHIAREAYQDRRKSPRTRAAGSGFADPKYNLATEWLEARAQIQAAYQQHALRAKHPLYSKIRPRITRMSRILPINLSYQPTAGNCLAKPRGRIRQSLGVSTRRR